MVYKREVFQNRFWGAPRRINIHSYCVPVSKFHNTVNLRALRARPQLKQNTIWRPQIQTIQLAMAERSPTRQSGKTKTTEFLDRLPHEKTKAERKGTPIYKMKDFCYTAAN
jgi:hypothetical protein